ncbi:MAG: Gfo/Idh/MocA family oxidoreductase [Verrucomicrobiales bacterium]|nr:Gfo/Idh/MocA family oxidoreductase [Verrucomicrobiales bacterium]
MQHLSRSIPSPVSIGRRQFLKAASVGAFTAALTARRTIGATSTRARGSQDPVRVAVIGIGSKDAVGGVGGRGLQLIDSLLKVPDARLVALCDVDQAILEKEARRLQDQGLTLATHRDLRRVLEDKDVDAVMVATPNHWHALATVWACQAGKDVYVEKPVSHNIWEGRQMVAAARKYRRMVQAGTQARSSPVLQEAFAWLQRGELGRVQFARVIVYRQRFSIGKVGGATAVPENIDYDLWCGPSEKGPLRRRQLHYDWHWAWATGGGEMGNNGVHYIDMCRWAMKLDAAAPRVVSAGGRFGYEDDGETPNTQIAVLDFRPAPIYCEVRALPERKGVTAMDTFQGLKTGFMIQCEGGTLSGAHLGATANDAKGRKIREFGPAPWEVMDSGHLANFIAAVRSRKSSQLNAEVQEGHLSAACCHQANLSCRLGATSRAGPWDNQTVSNPVFADVVSRYREHLRLNEVDAAAVGAWGPWLTYDTKRERFKGEHADDANLWVRRTYRPSFEVPEKV